jgi:outer membrane protein assembly factor BamD
MIYKKLIIILFPLVLVSCRGYEKLLKSTDYQLKYKKAYEYYSNGEYVRAATVYEQIASIFRGTTKSDTIQYYKAKSYYGQGDYTMAGHYFKELAEISPNGPFCEESYFMSAYCLYKLSPRPSLDQANTYAAIDAFSLFNIIYPSSTRVAESKTLINELNEKIVEKSYLNAKLYYRLSDYKAAIIALRNSLNDYPNTKYREELMFLLLRSSYLLAINSVIEKQKDRYQLTIDEYYSFIAEFPNGQYTEEAKDIYDQAMKKLGDNITQNKINE